MSIVSIIRKLLPLAVRKYIYRHYAEKLLQEAIALAEKKHAEDGHRYFILPCKNGKLKVTNADTETRDPSRLNDKRLLKRSVRKPYQLRKESFYFTASKVCKQKFVPDAMQEWELNAMRKKYYDWFFTRY